MNTSYTIKVEHETFGLFMNQTFTDKVQFKLFLKMVQACIELKQDFTYFDGESFLVHIPHKHLVQAIVTTNTGTYNGLTEHFYQSHKKETV